MGLLSPHFSLSLLATAGLGGPMYPISNVSNQASRKGRQDNDLRVPVLAVKRLRPSELSFDTHTPLPGLRLETG